MRVVVVALTLLLVAAVAWAEPVSVRVERAAESFQRAGAQDGVTARRDAYRLAAEQFQAIAADGHRNADLEFNTGNAYLLAGDHGRAILHLRRALRLDPGRAEFEANLAAARAARRDEIAVATSTSVASTLFFWHHEVPLDGRIGGATLAWCLAFGLLTARLLTGRPRGRGAAIVLLVGASALGGSAAVELLTQGRTTEAVVVADRVEVRAGDGMSYEPRYENPLHSGAEVEVTEERGGWVRIELGDGKSGWLPAAAIERI